MAALAAAIVASGLPGVGQASVSQAVVPTHSHELPAVHLVVDISGSMSDLDASGRVKLTGAKNAMTALLDGLASSRIPVGLRSYPGPGNDCGPGTLRAAIGTERTSLDREVRSLEAGGQTPTAAALEAAADDLLSLGFVGGVIVLVSDGEANCGQDPCEVAGKIVASGIDITVNTIGFDISESGRSQLTCIAEATGGEYRDAEDADDLADELQDLAAGSLELDVVAPRVVLTSVGRGGNPEVRIRATVMNPSPNDVAGIRVRIATVSDVKPFIARPLRHLANLTVGDRRTVDWEFTPPLDFVDATLEFEITATARNAEPVTERLTIALRGAVTLGDAGPLLQDREHVVIVGDSYSSGEGAGSYLEGTDTAGNPCHRSDLTYGQDLWPQRTIVACSGATTADLWRSQFTDVPPQIDQLDALDRDPDLVLTTFGGNDVGFGSVILRCLLPGDCHTSVVVSETTCDEMSADELGEREADEVREMLGLGPAGYPTRCYRDHGTYAETKAEEIASVTQTLVEAYRAIDASVNSFERLARRGQPAPIVVLAYPSPVPDPQRYDEVLEVCPGALSYEEWKWVTTFQASLNAAIRTAVERVRDEGVPIYFAGDTAHAFGPSHTICDDDSYINSLDGSDIAVKIGATTVRFFSKFSWLGWVLPDETSDERRYKEAFHPNANGYRAMTAGLVEYSQSTDAQRPVEHARLGPSLDWPPSDVGRSGLRIWNNEDLPIGSVSLFELEGLQPGSTVSGYFESTLGLAARAVVAADGTAELAIPVADDAELGNHTVTVAGVLADGEFVARSWEVAVVQPPSATERWAPRVMLALLVIAALAGAVVGVSVVIGRRRAVT